MQIAVMRKGFALCPVGDEDREALVGIESGRVYHFDFKKQRNSAFHRKFFALLTVVAQISPIYDTPDKALVAAKILVGHCDFTAHPQTGELVAVPKSISFAKMDQLEFEKFYSRVIDAVLAHIVPTMDRAAMDQAVNEIVGFS